MFILLLEGLRLNFNCVQSYEPQDIWDDNIDGKIIYVIYIVLKDGSTLRQRYDSKLSREGALAVIDKIVCHT